MVELRMDAGAVAALAQHVCNAAERIDAIGCPTMDPADLAGSAVAQAVNQSAVRDRLAEVATLLRTWAVTAQGSAAALDSAQVRHARRLDSLR